MSRARKVLLSLAALPGAYVVIAVGMAVFAPPPAAGPDLSPGVGQRFGSTWEKVHQTVLELRGDDAFTELVLEPGSHGPPLHYHKGFDEAFEVIEGMISLDIDGKKLSLKPGDKFRIEAGKLHRPYNETNEPVVVRGVIPRVFATCLSQFYGYLDARPQNAEGVGPLLQLSMMHGYCDMHQGPGPVEKVMWTMLQPIARAKGLRSFYPEYAVFQTVSPPAEPKAAQTTPAPMATAATRPLP